MPRNILLTFLGAGPYKKCVFEAGEKASTVVRFVQEALAQLVCREWSEDDVIYVFLTREAEKQNWEGARYADDPEDSAGLRVKLDQLELSCRVIPVNDLTDGFTEKDVWINFQKIFECIEEKDHVWLDITNAFRSIPVFASVLLHYARFLREIEVRSVFYGAFEYLGPSFNIEERIPNLEDRRAPLLNLVNVIALQQWTNAANDFLNHGSSREIAKLSFATGFPELAEALKKVTLAFSVSRGREITQGQIFRNLETQITTTQNQERMIAPLQLLLGKMKNAFSDYSDDSVENGIRAARWCLEHQLIQQGITILRETIISRICREGGLREDEYKSNRKRVETAFNCFGRELDDWATGKFTQEQIHAVIELPSFKLLANLYQLLSHEYRNDINHGGFLDWAKPAPEFEEILKKSLEEISQLLSV